MSSNTEQEEMDKYLSGEMGAFEKGLFEHKLAQDENLRYELEVRRLAVSMIEMERRRQLKEYIRKNTPHKRQLSFWQQVTLYSSVACALVAFVFWVMLQIADPVGHMAYQQRENKPELQPARSNKTDANQEPSTSTPPESAQADHLPLFPTEEKMDNIPFSENAETENKDEDVATAPAAEGASADDYAIKSDEMILDTSYLTPVFQLASMEETETTKMPAAKTDSRAAAPAATNKARKAITVDSANNGFTRYNAINIKVEFWNSPIHYKGYRFNGIKLQLYGIHDPGKIKFKMLDDELYMWNAGVVCKILREDRYNSYWPESDKSILKLFR